MAEQKLSPVERDILSKLSIKQLQFLSGIAHNKDFETLVEITKILVDYEKNYVFRIRENDPDLAVLKANARGRAGGYTQFGRIIMSASEEIERRENEIEKRKEVVKDA